MNGPLFTPRATTIFRALLLASVVVLTLGGFTWHHYFRSAYGRDVALAPDQPVLFSHRHHAGDLRIDCRYCHTSVETSAFAGMPSTHTCLTCHSQIFTDTPMLRPVVESASRDTPLPWNRVTTVPDYVYFNHSIHIAKGVACITCHGELGEMALTAKAHPILMRWCLDCHRDPGPNLRPPDQIFTAREDTSPAPSRSRGNELMQAYDVHPAHLTNCTTCHR